MKKSHDMTEAQRDRLAKLAAQPDSTIDTSDIPEAHPGAWVGAEVGRFYRPKKEAVTIRLDADILDFFRRNAGEHRGYQTAINAALRQHVTARKP
jgi:uncharacterized protein (DUF4415 family)